MEVIYMTNKDDDKHLFIYTLKLKTNQQDRERLNKRFRMAQDIYRKTLIEVHKRYLKLKKDPLYKRASKLSKDDKERTALFKEVREKYQLQGKFTFGAFANNYRNARNYSSYIPSDVANKLGHRAYDAYEKVMFAKGAKKVDFHKVVNSMEGKSDNGIMIRSGIFKMGTKTSKAKFSCPVIYAEDSFEEEILRNKVKFVRLVRKLEYGQHNFYAQIILEGTPVVKNSQNDLKTNVGIKVGLTTVAVATDYETQLFELAPSVKNNEKELAKLNQKMDRQRRANNPENYNSDGTIKPGRKTWKNSKRYLKTKQEHQELERLGREQRRHAHERLSNQIVEMGDSFIVEKMPFAELAKRYSAPRKNKSGKFLSSARFGKHIKRRAPASLITLIQYKAKFRGRKFLEINVDEIVTSQLDHSTGEKTPLETSKRIRTIDNQLVQSDLYSAFILKNVDPDSATADLDSCKKDFDNFLTLQEETMNNLVLDKTTPSMGLKKWIALKKKHK